jgi:fumarate hydratase class I
MAETKQQDGAPAAWSPLFQKGPDTTEYERLDDRGPELERLGGRDFLMVPDSTLENLAKTAFLRISHLYRASHLERLRAILDDPDASENDRYVAHALLKNAVIASAGQLPMCQDTGTGIVVGEKGQGVLTEGADAAPLSRGLAAAFSEGNLRYSQMAPLTLYEERNTGSNLPAQIDISAVPGGEYRLLFVAKGGGSANKTFLFQQNRRVLSEDRLLSFLGEKIRELGTAACPPYHLAVVIGGLSAEHTLKTLKLASCHDLDGLPETGDASGRAFRDHRLEAQIQELTRGYGLGAQFGGKYFCHDVRVVRLPRHGASLPIGLGVSCSADRQAKAKITAEGVFLEKLEAHPELFLPELDGEAGTVTRIDLSRPMSEVREALSKVGVGGRVSLSGPLLVARDIVHAKLSEGLARGEELPAYVKEQAIYYAGPAKTPAGMPSGSFGPTTAARMDGYVADFQAAGGALVTLGKGNRSPAVAEACARHGGFYLGSIGGAAAAIAQDHIRSVEIVDFEELGMEAAWRIEVEDFPAFVVVDDKGNDFFARGR